VEVLANVVERKRDSQLRLNTQNTQLGRRTAGGGQEKVTLFDKRKVPNGKNSQLSVRRKTTKGSQLKI